MHEMLLFFAGSPDDDHKFDEDIENSNQKDYKDNDGKGSKPLIKFNLVDYWMFFYHEKLEFHDQYCKKDQ